MPALCDIVFGVAKKRTVIFRTILASLFLVAYAAVSFRLSSSRTGADWIVFASPAILLFFELAGIVRTYQKKNENVDQLVRWIFNANLVLMVAAEIIVVFRA
ncbi:MAG: hypothetical protein ACRD3F_00455 [Acidobacteriaceae bacterium]